MKTFQEYPATHSMSTSWYAVDDAGNVALVDYNENGPVPWGIEETTIDAIAWGHDESVGGKKIPSLDIKLSIEQILEMCDVELTVDELDKCLDVIVFIDKQYEQDFLSHLGHRIRHVVSSEEGVYLIEVYDCEDLVARLINDKVILRALRWLEPWLNDEYEDGEVVHTCNVKKYPYYLYHQSYWPSCPTERMLVPEHPVTIDQVPESLRPRMHHIPGLFKDMKYIQVAAYYPFAGSPCSDVTTKDGVLYSLLPISKDKKAYLLSHFWADLPPKVSCEIGACGTNPTVCLVKAVKEHCYYNIVVQTDPINQHTIIVPLHPYIFNKLVPRLYPRVFLVTTDAWEKFNATYPVENHMAHIGEWDIPVYRVSEKEDYRKEIESLALSGYRGKTYPQVVSIEDMDAMIARKEARKDCAYD